MVVKGIDIIREREETSPVSEENKASTSAQSWSASAQDSFDVEESEYYTRTEFLCLPLGGAFFRKFP